MFGGVVVVVRVLLLRGRGEEEEVGGVREFGSLAGPAAMPGII